MTMPAETEVSKHLHVANTTCSYGFCKSLRAENHDRCEKHIGYSLDDKLRAVVRLRDEDKR